MSTDCIDLRSRWGGTYRLGLDPAADTPLGRADPWLVTMPCKRGLIYPWGGEVLAVEIDYRPQTARAVAALPGVTLVQDGDREKTFTFSARLFGQVAAVVLPRRRRRLSAEHKARLAESGAGFRFGHGSQSRISPRESHAGG